MENTICKMENKDKFYTYKSHNRITFLKVIGTIPDGHCDTIKNSKLRYCEESFIEKSTIGDSIINGGFIINKRHLITNESLERKLRMFEANEISKETYESHIKTLMEVVDDLFSKVIKC